VSQASAAPPIELRESMEGDAPVFLDLILRNRDFLQPFEPRRPDGWFTLDGVRAELARAARDRRSDAAFSFGIWERESGALVGRVTLANVVRGAWQNATLGYFVGEQWGRRGYATWAVREALAFAFGWANLHRVQAAVMPRNRASVRVLEKNRFRREGRANRYLRINGIWEDHDVYALTVEEWEGSPRRRASGPEDL
jgi:ribosomal-protein-alanine N-acetyltransferase